MEERSRRRSVDESRSSALGPPPAPAVGHKGAGVVAQGVVASPFIADALTGSASQAQTSTASTARSRSNSTTGGAPLPSLGAMLSLPPPPPPPSGPPPPLPPPPSSSSAGAGAEAAAGPGKASERGRSSSGSGRHSLDASLLHESSRDKDRDRDRSNAAAGAGGRDTTGRRGSLTAQALPAAPAMPFDLGLGTFNVVAPASGPSLEEPRTAPPPRSSRRGSAASAAGVAASSAMPHPSTVNSKPAATSVAGGDERVGPGLLGQLMGDQDRLRGELASAYEVIDALAAELASVQAAAAAAPLASSRAGAASTPAPSGADASVLLSPGRARPAKVALDALKVELQQAQEREMAYKAKIEELARGMRDTSSECVRAKAQVAALQAQQPSAVPHQGQGGQGGHSEQHEAALAQLRSEHSAALDRLKAEYSSDITMLTEFQKAQVRGLEERYEAELQAERGRRSAAEAEASNAAQRLKEAVLNLETAERRGREAEKSAHGSSVRAATAEASLQSLTVKYQQLEAELAEARASGTAASALPAASTVVAAPLADSTASPPDVPSVSTLTARAQAAEAVAAALRGQIATLTGDLEAARTRIRKQDESMQHLRSSVESARAEATAARSAASARDSSGGAEKAALLEKERHLTAEVAALRAQLDAAIGSAAFQSAASSRADAEEHERDRRRIQELDMELRSARIQVSELSAQLQAAKAATSASEEARLHLKATVEELGRAQASAALSSASSTNARTAEAEAEVQQLAAALSASERAASAALGQVALLTGQLLEAHSEVKLSRYEMEELRGRVAELAAYQDRVAGAEREAQMATGRTEALRQAVASAESAHAEALQQIAALQAQLATSAGSIAVLESQARQQLESHERVEGQHRQLLVEVQAQAAELTNALSALQSKYESESSAWRAQQADLQASVASTCLDAAAWKAAHEELLPVLIAGGAALDVLDNLIRKVCPVELEAVVEGRIPPDRSSPPSGVPGVPALSPPGGRGGSAEQVEQAVGFAPNSRVAAGSSSSSPAKAAQASSSTLPSSSSPEGRQAISSPRTGPTFAPGSPVPPVVGPIRKELLLPTYVLSGTGGPAPPPMPPTANKDLLQARIVRMGEMCLAMARRCGAAEKALSDLVVQVGVIVANKEKRESLLRLQEIHVAQAALDVKQAQAAVRAAQEQARTHQAEASAASAREKSALKLMSVLRSELQSVQDKAAQREEDNEALAQVLLEFEDKVTALTAEKESLTQRLEQAAKSSSSVALSPQPPGAKKPVPPPSGPGASGVKSPLSSAVGGGVGKPLSSAPPTGSPAPRPPTARPPGAVPVGSPAGVKSPVPPTSSPPGSTIKPRPPTVPPLVSPRPPGAAGSLGSPSMAAGALHSHSSSESTGAAGTGISTSSPRSSSSSAHAGGTGHHDGAGSAAVLGEAEGSALGSARGSPRVSTARSSATDQAAGQQQPEGGTEGVEGGLSEDTGGGHLRRISLTAKPMLLDMDSAMAMGSPPQGKPEDGTGAAAVGPSHHTAAGSGADAVTAAAPVPVPQLVPRPRSFLTKLSGALTGVVSAKPVELHPHAAYTGADGTEGASSSASAAGRGPSGAGVWPTPMNTPNPNSGRKGSVNGNFGPQTPGLSRIYTDPDAFPGLSSTVGSSGGSSAAGVGPALSSPAPHKRGVLPLPHDTAGFVPVAPLATLGTPARLRPWDTRGMHPYGPAAAAMPGSAGVPYGSGVHPHSVPGSAQRVTGKYTPQPYTAGLTTPTR